MGNWCLTQENRNFLENIKYEIAHPIGSTNIDKDSLFELARGTEFELFPRFTEILNKVHGTQFSERYWKIVAGHWFRTATELIINRIITVQECLKHNSIQSITVFKGIEDSLVSPSFYDFSLRANEDKWNCYVLTKIIKILSPDGIKLEDVYYPDAKNLEVPKSTSPVFPRSSIKQRIYKILRKWAARLSRETDAVILSSYLPLQYEFLLGLALKQIPQWRIPLTLPSQPSVNIALRENLIKNLGNIDSKKLEEITFKLILEMIPLNILEGFNLTKAAAETSDYPSKPRFIFTSNNFVYDDMFKMWLAGMVELGVPYFAGQHGNNYGTDKYYQETIEEVTSDIFITWGWTRSLKQHVPAFVFKNVGKSVFLEEKRDRLLLVETMYTPRVKLWDQQNDFDNYMKEQFCFINLLNLEIRESLIIRLFGGYRNMLGNEDQKWEDFDSQLRIDEGDIPIRNFWPTNRLIVYSYDSTGLIETLEANIPTLAFWQNGLTHLVEEAIPFYLLLVKAGIVHLTPESAAQKINEIWDHVDYWWWSDEVQNARREFCSQYARTSNKPIRELKKILLENI